MVSNPVLKTLIYENIFDFPLYRDEIWKFLISEKKIPKKELDSLLKDKKIHFDKKTNLYGLRIDEQFYNQRIKRYKESLVKERISDRAINLLSKIPTILMIAISGSLAQFSSKKEDDIDLFVLVDKNSVWITRLICVIFLKFFGLYRSSVHYQNKICLNMITDEIALPNDRRDLYNAFEIAQLRPKFNREEMYQRFISANSWTKNYLPNFDPKLKSNNLPKNDSSLFLGLIFKLLVVLGVEKIASFVQLMFMKQRTTETVGNHLLAFHARNFRGEIMQKYNNGIASTRGH